MGKSCNIYAQAKNSQGELVDSKLFKDLLSYTGERELAKKFYAIGTNKTFLEKVGNKAKFDDLGEITFKSLKELAKIDLGKEKELSILNKKNLGWYL